MNRTVDPTSTRLVIQLPIPAEAWHDHSRSGDRSILTATIVIAEVSHQLKAIQVCEHNSIQYAVNTDAEDEIVQIHAAYDDNRPFETVSMEGLDYVITLMPHTR